MVFFLRLFLFYLLIFRVAGFYVIVIDIWGWRCYNHENWRPLKTRKMEKNETNWISLSNLIAARYNSGGLLFSFCKVRKNTTCDANDWKTLLQLVIAMRYDFKGVQYFTIKLFFFWKYKKITDNSFFLELDFCLLTFFPFFVLCNCNE